MIFYQAKAEAFCHLIVNGSKTEMSQEFVPFCCDSYGIPVLDVVLLTQGQCPFQGLTN